MATRSAPPAPGPAALWYGLLGAPAVWSLQLVVGYALVAVPCEVDPASRGTASATGVPGAAIAVSAVAFLLAAWALSTAIRSWRAAPAEERGGTVLERAVRHRIAFMAFAGIFVSVLFTIGVVFATVGLFVLSPCR